MDELEWARAELSQLEKMEFAHLEHLLAARKAVKVQRIRIEEIIKRRHPAIHRLPIELLARIFGFALIREEGKSKQFDVIRERRRNLAGVSRLWRDVILDTPDLWSDFGLTALRNQTPLKVQLRRSQDVPFYVTITDEAEYPGVERLLRDLLPTMNRWRSLHIYDVVDIPNLTAIIYTLNEGLFSSLVEFYVGMQHPGNGEYPDPHHLVRRMPVLKHLKLENFIGTNDFSTGPLETLELTFADGLSIPRSFHQRIPAQSLITLSLIGIVEGWKLRRNSIIFPLLRKLTLDISHPQVFLDAISAPKLQHFHYINHKSAWDAFGMYGLKFDCVHHLTFDATSVSVSRIKGVAFCQGFPNTTHAELHSDSLHFFFTPIGISGEFGERSQTPVDNWASLERLTILDSGAETKGFTSLVLWLENRRAGGLPKLHIKLTADPSNPVGAPEMSVLCRKLQDLCVLELDCLPLSPAAHFTGSTRPPYLILPAIEPDLVNDIFWVPTK